MADDWEQTDGSNKRVYEQFLEGDEMRDLFNMPQPAKKTHCEVPAEAAGSDSHGMTFDEYFGLLDDPATRRIFDSLSPLEISHLINGCSPAAGIPQSENEGDLGKSVPHTRTRSDPSPNPQEQLDLQNPRGTLLDDFFQSTPAPQDAINFDSGFAGRGKLVPSAEDMAYSQPGLMEVDDPFSLPELHYSPLPDYEHDIMGAVQQSKETKEQPAQVSQPPKKKNLRGRKMGNIHQIPGFPSSSEPLPSDLSLEEMCRSWPNHLHGVFLERFVEAGWGGKKVWNYMPEAARDGPKAQPWNKLTKRLMHTRRRMELEGRGSVGVGLTPEAMWKNFVAETSEDAAQQSVAVNAHSDSESTLHNPQHAEALQDITSYQNSQPEPEDPFEGMRCAFQAELDKQYETIALLLTQQHADWLLLCFDEVTSRVMQTWMETAHEHEARFIRENFVDDKDIPFDPVSRDDMLKRLGELISKALLASNPPRLATNEQEEEAFRQSHQLLVMEEQLSILKDWTSAWQQQLEQFNANSYFGIADGAAEQSGGGNQEQSEQLLEKTPSFHSTLSAFDHHTSATEQSGGGNQEQSEQLSEETPSFHSAFSAFDHHNSATEAGVLSYGEQTSIPQAFLDQSWTQDAHLSSDEQAPTSQTFLDQLQTQATVDATQNCVAGTPSTDQIKGGRKKLRMFPHAPSKDVVLSEQDLVDLDHIMANFPEHLALPHVMVRYLGPMGTQQGSHRGAYLTNDMVKKLFHHHNAKHGSELDHPDRFKGIHDWVMAQKDLARKVRRGDLPRRPKLASSSAGSRQEDSKDDEVYGDQVLEERLDGGPTPAGQHQQSNDNLIQAAQFTTQPIRFEAELAKLPRVSAEQGTQEQGNDQASHDEFAMLLDPRLFG